MPNGLFLSCTQLNVQQRIVKHAREFQASLEVTQDHHTAHVPLSLAHEAHEAPRKEEAHTGMLYV